MMKPFVWMQHVMVTLQDLLITGIFEHPFTCACLHFKLCQCLVIVTLQDLLITGIFEHPFTCACLHFRLCQCFPFVFVFKYSNV